MNEEQKKFIDDLLSKGSQCDSKTSNHSNCFLNIFKTQFSLHMRIDDIKLLTVGVALLPNILNYLVNIIPQFLYPYVVAYLQDLSSMSEDDVTINDLFDYIVSPEDESNFIDSPKNVAQ